MGKTVGQKSGATVPLSVGDQLLGDGDPCQVSVTSSLMMMTYVQETATQH
jgi:hypothetical protein